MNHDRYRILMVAPTSFFSDYGCHIRIAQEAHELQQRGHDVLIATYHNGDDVAGLRVVRSWDVPWIKRTLVGSSRHKIYLDAALSWRSLTTAMSFKPHIIHAHLHEGGLIGAVLKRIIRRPLVFDFQGSMTAEMLDHRFLASKSSPLYQPLYRLESWINRQADMVLTSSDNARQLLIDEFAHPATHVRTIADGIDTSYFAPQGPNPELRASLGIPLHRKVVVYLGLLAPYQGTNMLIESIPEVLQQAPDTHFLIMGYPDPAGYQAYAESLGVADYVTLPGRIRYLDSHHYLGLGDVAVAPKMSRTEGSGKIPQYMSLGMPVITFDSPVGRQYLGEHGIYAAYGDRHDLARKIIWALQHPDDCARIGQHNRELAISQHSIAHIGPQLEAVYRQLIPASKSHAAAD
jgi:glycosyltransferase involved in cell wall biosynthesis